MVPMGHWLGHARPLGGVPPVTPRGVRTPKIFAYKTDEFSGFELLPMGGCKKSDGRRRLDQIRGRHFDVRMHSQRLCDHTASIHEACVDQNNVLTGVWCRSLTLHRPLGRLRGGGKQALT